MSPFMLPEEWESIKESILSLRYRELYESHQALQARVVELEEEKADLSRVSSIVKTKNENHSLWVENKLLMKRIQHLENELRTEKSKSKFSPSVLVKDAEDDTNSRGKESLEEDVSSGGKESLEEDVSSGGKESLEEDVSSGGGKENVKEDMEEEEEEVAEESEGEEVSLVMYKNVAYYVTPSNDVYAAIPDGEGDYDVGDKVIGKKVKSRIKLL